MTRSPPAHSLGSSQDWRLKLWTQESSLLLASPENLASGSIKPVLEGKRELPSTLGGGAAISFGESGE
ncbi:hypothetical protein V6N13_043384 [Hibiscus sabdariffa]|uniref:Uncharacterized protein n=1 Tax=Hibiscus sabdariffa TaxID=183260 RepID=A0ABR2G1Z2_9ROSI